MELLSVLITGANKGIGLEFVRQIACSTKPPQHIFATYRNKDTTQELDEIQRSCPSGVVLHLVKLDVREKKDIDNLKKVVEGIVGSKGLTLLINNAGIAQDAAIPDVTSENLNIHFQVNTVGPILIAQEFLPLLKRAASSQAGLGMSVSRAAILNISSVFGSISCSTFKVPREFHLLSYKTSKAALNMAMRVLAEVIKEDKVLVVNICPGWVKTGMGSQEAPLHPQDSVGTMLETITKLTESNHGTFVDRFGKKFSW